MGYAMALGECLLCSKPFYFNPVKVPSFRVNGVKQPMCSLCMEQVNLKRKLMGVEEFVIPSDAYEACDESEL
jgi:hypothetical protein